MRTARIISFVGTWGSGLAQLVLKTQDGVEVVYCENAPFVRATAGWWPDENIILPGNRVNVAGLAGKEIQFTTDDLNVLERCVPV